MASSDSAIAVVMVGGPTTGTRFRPLSLHTSHPLLPIAGKPMMQHPVEACKKVPNLSQVFIIGFFDEKEFSPYLSSLSSELRVPVRYLREDKSHGSAGGLFFFRDVLMEEAPNHIFVINCDVCSSFPLSEMLEAHKKYGGMATLLVKKVTPDVASEFGELVCDASTQEILHYAEKPETFVSDKINCGVYLFSPEIFAAIGSEMKSPSRGRGAFSLSPSPPSFLRLDQDVFSPFAGKGKIFAYEDENLFWEQIKTPALALKCSRLYLSHLRSLSPSLLLSENSYEGKRAVVLGDVIVHPSAKIHATAKLGPNVSVASNVRVSAGARLSNCIVLDDVEIKDNAIVSHAIIGWKSTIGRWARVQGSGDVKAKIGVSILGEDVSVADEVVIVNCISLPHKELKASVQDEIIL